MEVFVKMKLICKNNFLKIFIIVYFSLFILSINFNISFGSEPLPPSDKNENFILENSYSDVNVIGEMYVGGLVGGNEGIIRNSYSSGLIIGEMGVAGLVANNIGIVNNSYSTCSVTGDIGIAGLIALNGGIIRNSYSLGRILGNEFVGGLVSYNLGIINNSYSVSDVSGTLTVASFVEASEGEIYNCYFYNHSNNPSNGINDDSFAIISEVLGISNQNYFFDKTNLLYNLWDEEFWYFSGNDYPVLKK